MVDKARPEADVAALTTRTPTALLGAIRAGFSFAGALSPLLGCGIGIPASSGYYFWASGDFK
jgi:hypothetical protein